MKIKNNTLVCIILLILFILSAGCDIPPFCSSGGQSDSTESEEPGENGPLNVEMMTAAKSDITSEYMYPASMEGRQSVKIIPRIEGYIQKIHILEGERVRRGQLLFSLESSIYQAAVKAAEANIEIAKANIRKADLDYTTKKKLREKNIVSEFDVRQAEMELLAAKAQQQYQSTQLSSAKINLSYTELRSPTDGVAGRLPCHVGDYIGPGASEALTTIADDREMYVYFSLSENEVMGRMAKYGSMQKMIEAFPEVSLRLPGNIEYPHRGRILRVSGIVESDTGALHAYAAFPNPDGVLLSGGSGQLVIPQKYSQVIVIPREATFEILNKVYVYKIADGHAVSAIVQVIPVSDGKNYIVTEGLNEGEKIIARGAAFIQEGAAIAAAKGE